MKSFVFYSRELDQLLIRVFKSKEKALAKPFYHHLAFVYVEGFGPERDETTKVDLDFVFIGEL